MHSMSLLAALRQLPRNRPPRQTSHRQLLTDLADSNPALQAAEATAAASLALWGILPHINIDDRLFEAYELAYPGLAVNHSLHDHYLRVTQEGDASLTGLVSGLKGKLAELHAKDILQQNNYTNIEIAESATQPAWDISAINPLGELEFIQVKTGTESYAGEVLTALESNPEIHFMVSSEIYSKLTTDSPELLDQLSDVGSGQVATDKTTEGLSILSSNMGIDIPDTVGDILPGLAGVLLAIPLIYGAIKTERGFKDADRTYRNKRHVVQTLTLMSRFGVHFVLAKAGAFGGTLLLPGAGTIGGLAVGATAAHHLNKHLQPHLLALALDVTGLTLDDVFYYKNKLHIDRVAVRIHETAQSLTSTNWPVVPN